MKTMKVLTLEGKIEALALLIIDSKEAGDLITQDKARNYMFLLIDYQDQKIDCSCTPFHTCSFCQKMNEIDRYLVDSEIYLRPKET
jgi:hypothetical protein